LGRRRIPAVCRERSLADRTDKLRRFLGPKERGPQNDNWIQRARLLLNLDAVVIEGFVDQVVDRFTRHLKVVGS